MGVIDNNETTIKNLVGDIKLNPTKYEINESGDHVKVYLGEAFMGYYDKEIFFGEYHKVFPSIKNTGFFDRGFYNSFFNKK